MRIHFFTHYFPPEVNAPASRTHENARHWVKLGHEVTVITCAPNCPRGEVFDGYSNKIRKVETVDGIRVVRVWTFIAPNKGSLRRILNYLSYFLSAVIAGLFEKKPDVMIATSPQFFCGWAGVVMKWLRGWRFVLEIRDIWPESISTVGAMKKGLAFRFLEWMEHVMYRAADHIVAVGEGYRQQLMSKGVPGSKVSVIYNGVDLDLFSKQSPDIAFIQKYGLEGYKVCGYIGTVGMAHAMEIFLRAAQRTKHLPWKYLIVGDGARLDELKSMAREAGLEHVVFTGRLAKNEMPSAWSALDACLIHLKKSELFTTVIPSKMFEAMGMGIPILMGVQGEALDLVIQAKAGLAVEPENDGQLIERFSQILDQGPEEFGQSGIEFVTRCFDRRNLAEAYLNTLNLRKHAE
jgi:glycosyltransferase involved in cell wall biosynthesis